MNFAPPSNPFGIDFWIGLAPGPNANAGNTILDGDPSLRTATGPALLIQSLLCRQTTPRGSVIDCPNDCLNIQDALADGMTASQIQQLCATIQNELLKDQRVTAAFVTGVFNGEKSELTLTEMVQSSSGPFSLVLNVSAVTVTLLNANLLAGS